MSTADPDQDQLRGVLDVVNDAVILQDMEGIVTYVNHRAAEMYRHPVDEAVGMHIADLVDQGDRVKFEAMRAILARDGEWSGRIVNTDATGRSLTVEVRITVVRDGSGRPTSVFSMATDVTSRVELEDRLARTQKLESIGELSGGVAHDFNNLLTVILGTAEMLRDELGRDVPLEPAARRELAELAEQVIDAAARGARLTDRLLAFARRQTLQPEVLDVGELLDGMADLIRRSLTGSFAVHIEHAGGLWNALADPVQLESAIVNLAVNARDAMPRGGRVTITADNVQLDRDRAATLDDVRPGDYVRISVADDGHGMTDEVRDHAFDPFFTTKPVGRGTGLGLSMIHGFARQSGGHVEIVRTGPDGTTIELLLPRAGDGHEPTWDETVRSVGRSASRSGTGRVVLVVEDEPEIRIQTRRVLERSGYRVLDAADGTSALELLDQHDHVDLVVTDVVMPGGLSGLDVAEQVTRRRPGLPVLLISGFATDALGGRPTQVPMLPKPFRRHELLDAVRWLLDPDPDRTPAGIVQPVAGPVATTERSG